MYELVLLQQKTNYRNIIFQFCYYIFRLFTTSSYTFSCVVIYLKMRKYLTLATKQIILDEAYCRQGNIKATARKYDVQPQQIRRWKKTFRNPMVFLRLRCFFGSYNLVSLRFRYLFGP